jgi:hypothetical protein
LYIKSVDLGPDPHTDAEGPTPEVAAGTGEGAYIYRYTVKVQIQNDRKSFLLLPKFLITK